MAFKFDDERLVPAPGAPPVLTNVTPGDGPVRIGKNATFNISATDPENDMVSIQWTLDGTPVGAGPSVTLSRKSLGGGDHVLKATATDGKQTASHDWSVRAKKAPGPASLPSFEAALSISVIIPVSSIRRRKR